MLYVLVVCASGLCMPVDSFGAYKLTLSECQERVVEMRRLTHAVSFDCYLSENNSEDDSDWLTDATVVRAPQRGIVKAHPRRSE
jgi:hypothetical protein